MTAEVICSVERHELFHARREGFPTGRWQFQGDLMIGAIGRVFPPRADIERLQSSVVVSSTLFGPFSCGEKSFCFQCLFKSIIDLECHSACVGFPGE